MSSRSPRTIRSWDTSSEISSSPRIMRITWNSRRRWETKAFAPARGLAAASPMQHIMRDFLDATQFYLEMHDHPKEMRQLCEDMEPFYDRLFRILADAPAEVVFPREQLRRDDHLPAFFPRPYHALPAEIGRHAPCQGKVSHLALRRGEPGAPGFDRGKRDRYRRSHLPAAHDQGDDHGREKGLSRER